MKLLGAYVFTLTALSWISTAPQRHVVYEGAWHTTNRSLDGSMVCEVTDLGGGNWRGRFHGTWHGTSFDYPVTFSGPPSHLHGTATIDGADYFWTGAMGQAAPGWFKGTFGGSRYQGSFDLKERPRR